MRVLALPLVLLAIAAGGCSVTTTDPAPAPVPVAPVNGTLTIDWTINNTTDPNQCSQSVVQSIRIDVTDTTGASAGTYEQACTAFATSITLPEGRYSATSTLIDSSGQNRTTAVPIAPFTINGDGELTIPIDFPANSFD